MKSIALFVLLAATLASAEVVVLSEKPLEQNFPGYRSVVTRNQAELNVFSESSKTRVGRFPALVDTSRGVWVFIEDTLEAAEAELDVKINDAKTDEQKVAENAFFTLTETIMTAVADPRVGETPPIKLKFSEINVLIKSIQAVDPMQAVLIAVELLSIDAELKRFDTLWWDKAATHVIPAPPAE